MLALRLPLRLHEKTNILWNYILEWTKWRKYYEQMFFDEKLNCDE